MQLAAWRVKMHPFSFSAKTDNEKWIYNKELMLTP